MIVELALPDAITMPAARLCDHSPSPTWLLGNLKSNTGQRKIIFRVAEGESLSALIVVNDISVLDNFPFDGPFFGIAGIGKFRSESRIRDRGSVLCFRLCILGLCGLDGFFCCGHRLICGACASGIDCRPIYGKIADEAESSTYQYHISSQPCHSLNGVKLLPLAAIHRNMTLEIAADNATDHQCCKDCR